MQHSSSMQIKTLNDEHKCQRQFRNKNVNSRWLTKHYLESFRSNPKQTIASFRETVMRDHVVQVSRSQSYRARELAMKMIEGTYKEQYGKLWGYIEELKRTNPGSTVIMKLQEGTLEQGEPRFERLYVCLAALKACFKAGCRPFIGVDGCFLKGPHGGQLLAAVGVDANNCMFPLAYAVVEGENKSSWTWFLEILIEDLGIVKQEEWTIISDKQKGLVPASFELLPKAEHRFCVMHLHANFKTAGYNGNVYKEMLWNAAMSINVPHFVSAMKKLKDYKLAAYEWFEDKPPAHWSRSHFSTLSKCDMLLNNICENFNKCIFDAREKPIPGLLEKIRVYLMVRMQQNREKASKWEGKLCPKIKKVLEKYKLDSAN